jgi:hypothetical protein
MNHTQNISKKHAKKASRALQPEAHRNHYSAAKKPHCTDQAERLPIRTSMRIVP